MNRIRSICNSLLLITIVIQFTFALYEDQVGKFDWRRSYVGKVKYAKFDAKKLIVVTEENVLASLSVKNGNILWRQLLENPKEQQIQLLHLDKEIVTVSGTSASWFVRSWDVNSGTLLSEWTIIKEKSVSSVFSIIDDKLVHIVPVVGSHLEVSLYHIQNGEEKEKSYKISAPWITNTDNCVLTKHFYTCLSSNDISGQLYYVDVTLKNAGVQVRPLLNLLDHNQGQNIVQIIEFESEVPALLLLRNKVAKILTLGTNLEVKSFELMPNAITVQHDTEPIIYQLEATDNPEKLIRVKSKDYTTGDNILSIDLAYPLGLGAPIITAGQSRDSQCDLLLSTTDDALLLVRLPEGKILWSREEALSNIVATEFFELPVSELDASIENEFKTSSSNILNMLVHRLSSQAKQLSNLIFGGQLLSSNGLVRDEFGLHKIIVMATRVGKLFAIDTLTGSIAWSYRLPGIRSFKFLNEEKMMLFVQRTARYAPTSAKCLLLAEDESGNGILFQFDPITGYSKKGIEELHFKVTQAMLLPYEDENNIKPLVILSNKKDVCIYPESAKTFVHSYIPQLYMYVVDAERGFLTGFNFHHSKPEHPSVTPAWEVKINPSKLVALSAKHPSERVHSQGRVLPDRSVYYKYVNPNLIAVATMSEDPIHRQILSVYLIDGVTGLIMYSTSHKRVKGPVHLVHSENWLVYSYFNERFRRTEIVSAELYEGHIQSNTTVFSSHAASMLPHVQTQAYILPASPVKIAVTLTERGITNKFLLIGLSNGAVFEIPWLLLQPRFNDIPCGPEESCIPYMPEVPLPPEAIINYNQTLNSIRGIEVAPARLESTIHVLIHGLDTFYTRVAPSKTFDLLKEDFDHLMIVLVLSALVIASYITKHLASRKALKQVWK